MTIGTILKDLRLEAELTQNQLAKNLEIGQSTIVGYEKEISEPSIGNLIRYAKYFNVSLDYLVGRTDELGAINMPGTNSALSSDERELLDLYHSIRPDLQPTFWNIIRGLSSTPSEATSKKKA